MNLSKNRIFGKNGKSAGADLIPAEFVKYSSDTVASDITDIFNYMIEYREFPVSWTEGLRTPVFKNGNKLDVNNYRGISVLPIF